MKLIFIFVFYLCFLKMLNVNHRHEEWGNVPIRFVFELKRLFSKRNPNFNNCIDKVQYCSTYRYHLYFSASLPALRPSVLCRVPPEVSGLRPHRPCSPGLRRLSHPPGPKLGSILLHRAPCQQRLTNELCRKHQCQQESKN